MSDTGMARVGRPTAFRDSFHDDVIDYARGGLSYAAIAVKLGVSRDSLYEWMRNDPDFSDTMKRAREIAMAWWEETLKGQATGTVDGGSATAAIFAMKNQFPDDYRDRKELKVDAEVGVFEIDFQGYDPESNASPTP